MFRFANPEYLYFFIAIPIFIVGFIFLNLRKKANVEKLGKLALMKQMMPELSLKRGYLKFWLVLVAMCLGIIMVARPQFGTKSEKTAREGIEMVIAIDVSNSMLAQDVKPDRLTRAKQLLTRLINSRPDDKVAIVVFAGQAYIQLPMTSDTQSAKLFLETLNTNLVPVQGTALSEAIDVSMTCFTNTDDVEKAIILLTDAESHEGDALAAAKRAAEKGIFIGVLGIGSVDGAPIPIKEGSSVMRKDKKGEYVTTRLNENLGKEIAEAGDGAYFRVDNTNSAINSLLTVMDKIEKHELDTKAYAEYDEKFYIFAWAMFLLLLVEILIYDKKNRIFRNIHLFK